MKKLWKISIATSLEAEEAVIELLNPWSPYPATAYFNLETGVNTISLFSEKPFPTGLRREIAIGLKRIKTCGLAIAPAKIKIAAVKREDWAESWKKHFQPLEIASRSSHLGKAPSLLVKPSWSKQRPRKKQSVVVLDPGLSFGTGQHPTTSFCLREVVRVGENPASGQKSFLDIGTGSGILAIAAAKLGYQPVRAFDFDPEAVRIARTNALINGVKISLSQDDVTRLSTRPKQQYDLVCANLISNLLIAERKKIAAQLKPGGILVLAGILAAEFSGVQQAFETLGLRFISGRTEKEWRSGSFQGI
jgi:ribosomal protein L11 methyltransferase